MSDASGQKFDAIVIGAGFAGLYMLHRLRESGLSTRVLEAADGIGGTWYSNRYPGCRCDIESLQYSYQFSDELQQDWEWSERYATQPEILRYIEHVAERFDLGRDIELGAEVRSAAYDEDLERWSVTTADGRTLSAQFLISAMGCLSVPNTPEIPGKDDFAGDTYHTALWPADGVDFSGLRVGVIGTGSSAVQCIPHIAQHAEELVVFQRTANYVVPAWNGPLAPERVAEIKRHYQVLRHQAKSRPTGFVFPYNSRPAGDDSQADQEKVYEEFWQHGGLGFLGAYNDLLLDRDANRTAADFVQQRIRGLIDDPEVADVLVPTGIIGSKRLSVGDGYYESFNLPNVRAIDVSETPIERITAAGVVVGDDRYELDAIVFATGFDAITGAMSRVEVTGRDDRTMAGAWADGPRAYLGIACHGFPNLLMINGPGSPSVLSNMIQSAEHHVDLIGDCIDYMRSHGHSTVEAQADAEDAWLDHVADVVGQTLRAERDSWYVGANIPGRPRVFMPYAGGVPAYLEKCASVVERDFAGLQFR